jgi:hypothetical protein
MTTATDQALDQGVGPGQVYDRNDGSLFDEGKNSYGKAKNIFQVEYLPFHDSSINTSTGCNDKKIMHGYGRVTPVNNTIYGDWPIGSTFKVLTISSGAVTVAAFYKKVYSGVYGWSKEMIGSDNLNQTVTGTSEKMVRSLVTFSGNSCDNHNAYFKTVASGTSQMVSSVRGYSISTGNNSSVCGGDFTGELGVGDHSNGHVAAVHAQASVSAGLTVSGGALFSLLLTSYLGSAVTSLQHGGAAFIALTDQTATKTKYLIDAASDGSSLIDTGSGTDHLECYESDGMTFTCKGGYRIYTLGGGEMYVPFGTLAS